MAHKDISKILAFCQDLDSGIRRPITAAQRRFIKVCRGDLLPEKQYEKAYVDWKSRLKKNLKFYLDLDVGIRKPITAAQRRFIQVCRGDLIPHNEHEQAYLIWKHHIIKINQSIMEKNLGEKKKVYRKKKKVYRNSPMKQAIPDHFMISEKCISDKPARFKAMPSRNVRPVPRGGRKGLGGASLADAFRVSHRVRHGLYNNSGVPRHKQPSCDKYGIALVEDGYPRTEFGSRDDFKGDSAANFSRSSRNEIID